MKKESKFVSLVVYLYNCEEEINKYLETICEYVQSTFSYYELIFVDDDSTDKTVSIIENFFKNKKIKTTVNIVKMGYHQGLERSMNAGRDLSIGDFVYEFDTTNVNYDISVLRQVYDTMSNNYDIVAAKSSEEKSLGSSAFYSIFNRFSRTSNRIDTDTFKIISRRAINRINSMSEYIPYRKAIYSNSGLNYKVLEYEPISIKKINKDIKERTTLALDSLIYFTDALEKISLILSITFLLVTVIVGIYVLFDVFTGNTVEGWLSIMGFLSIGFFGVFTLLTIIIKYLSVLLDLNFKRQHYIVQGIEKIK